jgi:hypothetical protein
MVEATIILTIVTFALLPRFGRPYPRATQQTSNVSTDRVPENFRHCEAGRRNAGLKEELTAVSISSALNAQCWADITGRDPAKIILKKQNFRD